MFQFLFSIPLAIPAALAGSPSLYPSELPGNLWDGLRCYVGISSAKADGDDDEAHADDCNPQAPLFVNIYLIFNVGYNILIILILSDNIVAVLTIVILTDLGSCPAASAGWGSTKPALLPRRAGAVQMVKMRRTQAWNWFSRRCPRRGPGTRPRGA